MKSLGLFAAPGKPQGAVLAEQIAKLARARGLDVAIQIEHAPPKSLGGDGCPVRDEVERRVLTLLDQLQVTRSR